MEKKEGQEDNKGLVPWIALVTAVPIVILSAFGMAQREGPFWFGYDATPLWYAAGYLWLLGIIIAIGFSIAGKKEITKGIGIGIGIGFVSLVATFIGTHLLPW